MKKGDLRASETWWNIQSGDAPSGVIDQTDDLLPAGVKTEIKPFESQSKERSR